jgi:hypothetical protein
MIDVLQEPAAKRAAHVVQASLVEVQIPINVQSDLKQWKQEVEDIKKKKGGHIHVRTDSNKVVIFAIPKTNAKAIQEHVKIFHKYPDQKIRGTIHFSTKTGQTITTILGDITDIDNDVIVCSSIRTLSLRVSVGHDLVAKGKEETHLSYGMRVVPHSCDTMFYFYASRAPTWATFVVIINIESS